MRHSASMLPGGMPQRMDIVFDTDISTSGKSCLYFECTFFTHISVINILSIVLEIALGWLSRKIQWWYALTYLDIDHQKTKHHLDQVLERHIVSPGTNKLNRNYDMDAKKACIFIQISIKFDCTSLVYITLYGQWLSTE